MTSHRRWSFVEGPTADDPNVNGPNVYCTTVNGLNVDDLTVDGPNFHDYSKMRYKTSFNVNSR